jgi:hypothetical protein
VLLLLSLIPGIVKYAIDRKGSLGVLFITAVALFAIVVAVALIVILLQKFKLNKLIGAYNQQMKNLFNNIISNASCYSVYLSSVASHSRGISYLKMANRKKIKFDDLQFVKYGHIKNANVFLTQIKNWSKGYYLDIDFDNPRINKKLDINISENPFSSEMYTFEYGENYQVSLNDSGNTIDAPFSFVEKLEITREELYDDGSI